MNRFNYQKAVQVVNFFAIKEGGRINKMKALKLLFLSDRLHLRSYSRPIVNDEYFAVKLGPIASETKNIIYWDHPNQEYIDYVNKFLNQAHNYFIKSVASVQTEVFSKSDLKVLEKIYSEFGHLSQFNLSDVTHEFPEWKKFEDQIKSFGGRYPMDYKDFFEDLNSEDKVFVSNRELVDISKSLYLHG